MKVNGDKIIIRAGRKSDIPSGEGRVANWGDYSIAVFHTENGDIFALDNKCPHRGGPLADGILGGEDVHCPLHGMKIHLPTGKVYGETLCVKTYPVEEMSGEIFITVKI